MKQKQKQLSFFNICGSEKNRLFHVLEGVCLTRTVS